MSYPEDCYGCRKGIHAQHDPDWGLIPGIIGGAVCPCKGDCAERRAMRMVPLPVDPDAHAYRPDCDCLPCTSMRDYFEPKGRS